MESQTIEHALQLVQEVSHSMYANYDECDMSDFNKLKQVENILAAVINYTEAQGNKRNIYTGIPRKTIRWTARQYQRRTQQNKTITLRIGKEAGRAISTRVQVAANRETGTVCVSCALWHMRPIYPSRRNI